MKRQKLIDFRGDRTQTEMGKQYGVTQQAWSAWENGEKTPAPAVMKRIEIESGIPMEDIFFDAFNNLKALS